MIMSMTGYGRGEAADERYKITVEIKSVNHRYLDLGIKLPRKFNHFEAKLRNEIKNYAIRGKVDIFVTCEEFEADAGALKYNEALAVKYAGYFNQMSRTLGLDGSFSVKDIAAMPDVFTMEMAEDDEEYLWALLKKAFDMAGGAFKLQRGIEGANLKDDILTKLDGMERDVNYIQSRAPEIIEEYRERITSKIMEYAGAADIDKDRILTEVAIYADKVCVDEETVRLHSHIDGMRKALCTDSKESIGRQLDFIAQEMNREANTTLSKSNKIDISEAAVRLKTEIEKIREQVQNIE